MTKVGAGGRMTKQLSASLGDYLKATFHIVEAKGAARLGVGTSSVAGALKALAERMMVNDAHHDVVVLTPAAVAGLRMATGS